MNKEIFISHSSKDKDRVDEILKVIEDAGIKCWIAPRDVLGGMAYAEEIVDGIKACRIVLLVVSASIVKSEHILNEVELAINNSKIILPFKIDPIEYTDSYKYYLNRKHRIEALPDPQEYYGELVASLKHLLSKTEDNPDTEDDAELIAIRERNRKRLINSTKEKRLSFGLSIQTDSFADEFHFYKTIKRLDVIDTPNLKYSNYRWIEIENQSERPTRSIIHKECGDNKVRFSDMRFTARQYIDGQGELLDVDSQTAVQPNFEQIVKILFKKELMPGESTRVFYRLDWPGEPSAYCDELSTSISLTRYPKGVGRLTFGIFDTVPLYDFEIQEVSAGFEIKVAGATHKEIQIEDEPDLKPLHGKIKASGIVFDVSDAADNASYRILYKQRKENKPTEDDGF
ncbi:MAG TPA: toll/interleukin-1 receptor domain-containing protein [Clostridia bacterium]|nr:toll/interleukin-1 receptor domain-containing protein [Clostridia bacterium]